MSLYGAQPPQQANANPQLQFNSFGTQPQQQQQQQQGLPLFYPQQDNQQGQQQFQQLPYQAQYNPSQQNQQVQQPPRDQYFSGTGYPQQISQGSQPQSQYGAYVTGGGGAPGSTYQDGGGYGSASFHPQANPLANNAGSQQGSSGGSIAPGRPTNQGTDAASPVDRGAGLRRFRVSENELAAGSKSARRTRPVTAVSSFHSRFCFVYSRYHLVSKTQRIASALCIYKQHFAYGYYDDEAARRPGRSFAETSTAARCPRPRCQSRRPSPGKLPPCSGLPRCARPQQHRSGANGARCLAAAAGASSALALLAGAASVATTRDATRVFGGPSFFRPAAVACEAKSHSTETASRGSTGAQPDTGATAKKAAGHPPDEDEGSTVDSLKQYTWSFVNGSWLLEPVASLLASADVFPSTGSEADAEATPREARKTTGTTCEEPFGLHSNQSAARTPRKAGEEDAAASPLASVKEKVDELVAAIREKAAAAPAQLVRQTRKPQPSAAEEGQAGFDSAEASARQPGQMPQPATRSHAPGPVSELVEELTFLLCRNMPDTSGLPSMSDLSPSKLAEIAQTSVVSKKIEELTDAIRTENAVFTLSDY
ncbi:MAG: hypothetical protein BJ554DRAFT_822, partial [Olpidium bornovanus]